MSPQNFCKTEHIYYRGEPTKTTYSTYRGGTRHRQGRPKSNVAETKRDCGPDLDLGLLLNPSFPKTIHFLQEGALMQS